MANILDTIAAHKRQQVEKAKALTSQSQLVVRAEASAKPRNFFAAVTRTDGPKLRAIPQIAPGPKAAETARKFQQSEAVALAYPTDGSFAQGGRLDQIDAIKSACPLPLLQRDWIVDAWQLYESRIHGADAVVITAEFFSEAELIDMFILASQLQLTAILEVHSTEALLKVRPHVGFPHPGYFLLGISNRNPKSGKSDIQQTLRLIDMVEDTSILVSESGVRSHEDAVRLTEAGARAFLIDEGLCDADDPGEALRAILHS